MWAIDRDDDRFLGMSDKHELIAAAQVNAVGGVISFNSNFGFDAATLTSAGVYDLELDHHHGIEKLVVNVTRNNVLFGSIQASLLNDKHIAVYALDAEGAASDTPFFITVYRIRD